MKVIAGLGNPGVKYKNTRHNLGFMVVDGLSQRLDIELAKLKYKALIGQGELAGEPLILVKPMTYMNLSGRALKGLVSGLGLSLADIVVVCDDLNLPLGALRIRAKGSAGGNKGLASIIAALGSQEFTRVRLGIDQPPAKVDAADYVLRPFAKAEWPVVQEMLNQAQEAVCTLVEQGLEAAMNRFNQSV